MHADAYRWIADTLADLPRPTRVLEFGSRNINGSPRALLPDVRSYVGVDLIDGEGVDVVADVADYAPAQPADLVLCCEVLEHAKNAAAIVHNAIACTAPGGYLVITCATVGRAPHSAFDGGPLHDGEFYRNVTADELSAWLSDGGTRGVFAKIHKGDLYALAQVPA